MTFLFLIWLAAIILCVSAIVWMCVLIVLRMTTERANQRRARDRKTLEASFVQMLQGRCDVESALAPYRQRGRLIAETLLDFMTLVRGGDLDIVIQSLRSVGADDVLRERVNLGSAAGRRACVEALGAFPGIETCVVLSQAARRGSPAERLAALHALMQAGGEVTVDRLLDDVKRGDLKLSGPFSDLLCAIVGHDVPAAIQSLARPDITPALRSEILDALGSQGAYEAIPAITAHAQARWSGVRATAISALGRLMHPASEAAFRQALSDPASEVRSAAAEAIGDARLPALLPELAQRLQDPVWRVRHQAAAALVKFNEPGLVYLRAAARGAEALSERAASLILAERGLA